MLTRSRIFAFLALSAVAACWAAVDHWFGQTEAVRVWGIGLLLVTGIFSVRQFIPVYLGNRLVSELTGWRKCWVLLPALALGALVAFFPHEVACAINLRSYKCS